MLTSPNSVSLRWKLLGFALAIALAFVGSTWALHRGIVQPAFAELERRDALAHLERVEEAIASADNLARELGGSLLAASEGPGRWATFTFRVPARRSAA